MSHPQPRYILDTLEHDEGPNELIYDRETKLYLTMEEIVALLNKK